MRVAAGAAWMAVCLLPVVSPVNAQSIPSPWTGRDIGDPALSGSSSFSNGIFSIDAGGTDISGTADEFHFVSQEVSGDVDIRARIDAITRAHVWSKAGVMIRGSLAPGGTHAFAFVSASKGVGLQVRQREGGRSTTVSAGAEGVPRWLRVTRVGSAMIAYASDNGENWTELGRSTVALGSTVYVGLAVTSRSRNSRTSVTASNVQIAVPTAPAEEELPDGQSSADIGSPAISGSASFSEGRYTIRGSGADIRGTADQFHYVYRPVAGDVDVTARIDSLTATSQATKAGVMIRESLSPGSRHALALVSPGEGFAFQRRTETDTWSESTAGGTGALPAWVRLVRQGGTVTAYRSSDGIGWTAMESAAISMADTVYVGIAVTSGDVATSATASVSHLMVTITQTQANRPPAVLVSAPASGTTFTAPATLTFAASATDPDGTVERVEFRANGTLLGTDPTAPYASSATLAQGTYAITAVAVDSEGATTISDPVSISVSAAVDLPRGVAFTVSADHGTLVQTYILEVYGAGATPGVSTPVATMDLGKPAPTATGDVTVDCSAFFQALSPGNYLATVKAVGEDASARSAPVTFTR